jgi:hypothetical protein
MNRKTLTIIVLQALIIIIMFWLLVFYGKDEYEAYSQEEQEEEIASPPRVSTANGAVQVTLTPETQQQSGIAVSPLVAANYQPALSAFGTVVSLDSYSELRTRYLAARAEAAVVRASIANSQKEYQRLLQLNRDDDHNISDRAVAVAESAWKAEEAKLAAAETSAASIRDTIRQQWGDALAAWAVQQPAGEALQRLLRYQDALLQITLPFDAATPGKDAVLLVEAPGSGKPVRAVFVSAAPQTDAAIQGKTFFYRAPADNLRVGMRIAAHLPQHGKADSGVVVPASAVVWYGGKAWVYQKQGADRFIRRQVSTEREAGDGWFNAGSIKAGTEVVTSGAQLLLSEEFKYQITNENED